MEKFYVYVIHDSCDRRKLDGKKISEYLIKKGYSVVNKPKDADIVIFVTCAALNFIVENSINKIKEFKKYDVELIVAGCLPEIEKEKLAQVFNGRILTTRNIDDIDSLLKEDNIRFCDFDDVHTMFKNIDKSKPLGVIKLIIENIGFIRRIFYSTEIFILKHLFGEFSPVHRRFEINTSYIIRVSWGCLGRCSYCGIKKAIGKYISKPLNKCVDELKKGLKDGYKSFVITGDDSGAYGIDINSNLPELLDEMTKIDSDFNITFDSANPVWIVKYIDELEEIFKRNKIKYLGIPIQSANARILKLMGRYHNIEKMKETLFRIKKINPDMVLHTHCICGFPTETEEEFKDTLKFLKDANFNSCFFYAFSHKSGTPASEMQQVPYELIVRRMRYAKKFLKKSGYTVIKQSNTHFFAYKREFHK